MSSDTDLDLVFKNAAGKKVTVGLPKELYGTDVTPEIVNEGVCSLSEGSFNAKGSNVTYTVTPEDAGATWIIWTAYDEYNDEIQAATKVIVKKPLTDLSIEGSETPLSLNAGEGVRLSVSGTPKNTDTKELSFSSDEKGIKVSKSGYVIATLPGLNGTVTVKAGKVKATIRVKSLPGSSTKNMVLSKTSISMSAPKGTGEKSAKLKIAVPKKKAEQPQVAFGILGEPKGISVSPSGDIRVNGSALPGCYTLVALPEADGYNPVYCELIVK